MKTYTYKYGPEGHVICRDNDESTKDDCWTVISWLKDYQSVKAQTLMSLFNKGLYATALEYYDQNKF